MTYMLLVSDSVCCVEVRPFKDYEGDSLAHSRADNKKPEVVVEGIPDVFDSEKRELDPEKDGDSLEALLKITNESERDSGND